MSRRGGGGEGENWSKLCSLGGQVSTLALILETGDVVNLLLVEANLNPALCREKRFSGI